MGFDLSKMKTRRTALALALAAALGGALLWGGSVAQQKSAAVEEARSTKKAGAPSSKPALTVTLVAPQSAEWPQRVAANGNVAAWQEAVIGAEISGYRLTEVLVNVGDSVKKGQLLARIANDTVAAELAQSRAAAAEAEATLAEARANADRARQIQATGALSAQQISQYLTAEQTALARLNAAKARVQTDELRLSQTRVTAPDDGVISARAATVGSLAQPGQELFRLIRGGRLEWRAEVTSNDLARIKSGMAATLTSPTGQQVQGKVRMVAPTVDPQTRLALVYVDLPGAAAASGVRAGMFARGQFALGSTTALSLPQSAVVQREGFSYVYRVDADSRVLQTKVDVGRRQGERVEIVGGLPADARVVASGVGFLADGDLVRVVDSASGGAAAGGATSAAAGNAARK
jgi:RND family efflux transporter MFP subunit